MESNKPPIRGEGAPIVAYGSLGAAEGRVEFVVDPPDRFGEWIKVGELAARIGKLVVRFWEIGEGLGLWKRRRGPAAEPS